MTRFEEWIFRRIVRREVIQGDHRNNIIKMYSLIAVAAKDEFTEDNPPTLKSFLKECHDEALTNPITQG